MGARAAFSTFFCDDVAINLQPEPGGKTVAVMLGEEGAKQRLGACPRPRISTSPTPADCGSADSSGCSVVETKLALRIVPYGNRGGGIFIGVVAGIQLAACGHEPGVHQG